MRSNTSRQTYRSANRLILVKALGALVSYLFIIVLTQQLDAQAFGQVAFAISLAFFLSVLASCGQHLLVVRTLPIIADMQMARRFTIGSLMRNFIGATMVLAFCGIGWFYAPKSALQNSLPASHLFAAAFLFIAVCLADFLAHAARGCQRHILSIAPKELIWRGSAALALLIVPIEWGAVDVIWLLASLLTIWGMLQAVGIFFALSAPSDEPSIEPPKRIGQLSLWVTSVSNQMLALSDVIVVGMFLGPAVAGPYFLANRLSLALSQILSAHNQVIAPQFASAFGIGDMNALRRVATEAAARMSIPIVLLTVAIWAFAGPLITMLGDDFASAIWPLKLLALAACANALFGPADILLNMSGHEKPSARVAIVTIIAAGIVLPISAVLGGSVGVASAVLLLTLLRKFLFWHLAIKLVGYRTDALARLIELLRSRAKQRNPKWSH